MTIDVRQHIAKCVSFAGLAERYEMRADSHWSRNYPDAYAAAQRDAADMDGRAAGHAFRALEILYDREQAALAKLRRYEDPVERLAEMIRLADGRGEDPARALAQRQLSGACDVHSSWPDTIHRFVRDQRGGTPPAAMRPGR